MPPDLASRMHPDDLERQNFGYIDTSMKEWIAKHLISSGILPVGHDSLPLALALIPSLPERNVRSRHYELMTPDRSRQQGWTASVQRRQNYRPQRKISQRLSAWRAGRNSSPADYQPQ
jgi:hypothetical protein